MKRTNEATVKELTKLILKQGKLIIELDIVTKKIKKLVEYP